MHDILAFEEGGEKAIERISTIKLTANLKSKNIYSLNWNTMNRPPHSDHHYTTNKPSTNHHHKQQQQEDCYSATTVQWCSQESDDLWQTKKKEVVRRCAAHHQQNCFDERSSSSFQVHCSLLVAEAAAHVHAYQQNQCTLLQSTAVNRDWRERGGFIIAIFFSSFFLPSFFPLSSSLWFFFLLWALICHVPSRRRWHISAGATGEVVLSKQREATRPVQQWLTNTHTHTHIHNWQ